ncbi:MAG: DUF4167 domain-containing protein [Alphaproteobacteria bacterium]|nr:DUF4167 domain-containing protein [Alphaproteobacteria bacterium]MDP6873603.1 DUF4167 domain-containing protein [Alphaproteobacteria bacterium]
MRQSGPQRRGRGRPSGRRGFNNSPNRSYDSSGPDVKIRGTASTVYDKYMALGRDAMLSGDRVAAENFFQHAEHYYRLVQANKQQQQQAGEGDQRDNRGRGQQNRGGRGNEAAAVEGDGARPDGAEEAKVEEAKVVPATESLDDDTGVVVVTGAGTLDDASTDIGGNEPEEAEEARAVEAPMNPAELAAMSESGRKARGGNGANGRGRQKRDGGDDAGQDGPAADEAAPRRQPRRRRRPTPAPDTASAEATTSENESPAAALAEDAETS